MDKKIIKKEYLKKIELLNNYNQKYFNENKSIISDSSYDKLKKEIISLEKNYSFLDHKYSPTKTVGHKPSRYFKKIAHRVPMLSLGNAFDREDLVNFEKKNTQFFITK